MIHRSFTRLLAGLVFMCLCLAGARAEETPQQKYVVEIERIWDRAAHAAFTDVILHGEHLYCAFREGSGHIPGLNGVIRVIRSRDRMNWESVALIDEPEVDLRDPKLSITPDGRLMANFGASYYHGAKLLKIESRVAFAEGDRPTFGPPLKVELPEQIAGGVDWLWRITWHKGVAWGCVEQLSAAEGKADRTLRLVRSTDGVHFEEAARLAADAPSETTLRFLPDDSMLAMIRCEGDPKLGQIGTARPPYTAWKFAKTNKRFGGPNLVQLPTGRWLAGSRDHGPAGATTQLWWLDTATNHFREILTLPSGGDNSYPGFAIDEAKNVVYVSYYSSHEGKAAIYLATLRLDALKSANPE